MGVVRVCGGSDVNKISERLVEECSKTELTAGNTLEGNPSVYMEISNRINHS